MTMMPRLRQALVEFENIEDAIMCVQTSQVPVSRHFSSFWLGEVGGRHYEHIRPALRLGTTDTNFRSTCVFQLFNQPRDHQVGYITPFTCDSRDSDTGRHTA